MVSNTTLVLAATMAALMGVAFTLAALAGEYVAALATMAALLLLVPLGMGERK